jgi:gamma-glutamyltranspeptidase
MNYGLQTIINLILLGSLTQQAVSGPYWVQMNFATLSLEDTSPFNFQIEKLPRILENDS